MAAIKTLPLVVIIAFSILLLPKLAMAEVKELCEDRQNLNDFTLRRGNIITPIISGIISEKGFLDHDGLKDLPFIRYKTNQNYLITLFPIETPLAIGEKIIAGETQFPPFDYSKVINGNFYENTFLHFHTELSPIWI